MLGEPGAAFDVEGLLNIFFLPGWELFYDFLEGWFWCWGCVRLESSAGWFARQTGSAQGPALLRPGDAAWPTPMGKVTSFLLAAIDALVAYN